LLDGQGAKAGLVGFLVHSRRLRLAAQRPGGAFGKNFHTEAAAWACACVRERGVDCSQNLDHWPREFHRLTLYPLACPVYIDHKA
jgi:hypothetical protein